MGTSLSVFSPPLQLFILLFPSSFFVYWTLPAVCYLDFSGCLASETDLVCPRTAMKTVQATGIDLQKYPWVHCVIGNGRADAGHGGTTGATAEREECPPNGMGSNWEAAESNAQRPNAQVPMMSGTGWVII